MMRLFRFLFICFLIHISRAQQPNILFILADDLGAADVSFNYRLINPGKEPPILTPTLDRFANEGTILSSYYTDNYCGPSRNAILTSRWSHQIGNPFPFVRDAGSLPDTFQTIAKQFQKRGYSTAMFGKWGIDLADLEVSDDGEWIKRHSGNNYGPLNRGFDVFEGCIFSGISHWGHKIVNIKGTQICDHHRFDELGRRSAPGWEGAPGNFSCPEGEYSSHTTTRTAIEFLKDPKRKDKPFFMELSYFAPHAPTEAPEENIQTPQCQKLHGWRRQTYCGQVGTIDDGVKQVTDVMDELGLLDSSIIIFTSDNGAFPAIAGNNFPYRGGKNSIFEGGVRVPAFIYGPNFNVPSGKLHKKFTAHIDWGPTLLSIIDEASSNSHISNFIDDVDGMNFMPSIRKEPQAKERTRFLLHQNVLAPQYVYYEDDLKFLYNAVQFEAQRSHLYPEPDHDFPVHSSLKTWDMIIIHAVLWLLLRIFPTKVGTETAVVAAARIFTIKKDFPGFYKEQWEVSTGEPITLEGTYMPSVDFEWQWDRVRLHNVSADPSEQVDIKDLHKEKVQDMMKRLKEMTKTMPSQSYPNYPFFNKFVNKVYKIFTYLIGFFICCFLCPFIYCCRLSRKKVKGD